MSSLNSSLGAAQGDQEILCREVREMYQGQRQGKGPTRSENHERSWLSSEVDLPY